MATIYINDTLNKQGYTLTIGRNNVFACLTPKMAGALIEDFLADEKRFWRKWNPGLVPAMATESNQKPIVQTDENLPNGTLVPGVDKTK